MAVRIAPPLHNYSRSVPKFAPFYSPRRDNSLEIKPNRVVHAQLIHNLAHTIYNHEKLERRLSIPVIRYDPRIGIFLQVLAIDFVHGTLVGHNFRIDVNC